MVLDFFHCAVRIHLSGEISFRFFIDNILYHRMWFKSIFRALYPSFDFFNILLYSSIYPQIFITINIASFGIPFGCSIFCSTILFFHGGIHYLIILLLHSREALSCISMQQIEFHKLPGTIPILCFGIDRSIAATERNTIPIPSATSMILSVILSFYTFCIILKSFLYSSFLNFHLPRK